MNCPNCKASGSLRFVRAGAYVECVTPDCHWTMAPLDELVCDAAVYSWHRANPAAPKPLDHAFEDRFEFGDGECSVVVDEADEGVTRCGEPVERHQEAA